MKDNLPRKFSLDYPFIPKKDMTYIKDCIGFAISEWYETVYNTEYRRELLKYLNDVYGLEKELVTEEDLKFSIGFPYGNRSCKDYLGTGAITRQILERCKEDGMVLNRTFPCRGEMPHIYKEIAKHKNELLSKAGFFKIKDYIKIESPEQIKECMIKYRVPIIIVGNIYSNFFKTGKDGRVPVCEGALLSRKSMLVNGWKDNDLRILMNFGPEWGDHGHCHVNIHDKRFFSEMWVLIPEDHLVFPEDEVVTYRVRLAESVYSKIVIEQARELKYKRLSEEQKEYLHLHADYLHGEIIKEGDKYKLQVGSFVNIRNAYKLMDVLTELGFTEIKLSVYVPECKE